MAMGDIEQIGLGKRVAVVLVGLRSSRPMTASRQQAKIACRRQSLRGGLVTLASCPMREGSEGIVASGRCETWLAFPLRTAIHLVLLLSSTHYCAISPTNMAIGMPMGGLGREEHVCRAWSQWSVLRLAVATNHPPCSRLLACLGQVGDRKDTHPAPAVKTCWGGRSLPAPV